MPITLPHPDTSSPAPAEQHHPLSQPDISWAQHRQHSQQTRGPTGCFLQVSASFWFPATASASPHRDQKPMAHLCQQHPTPRRVAGRVRSICTEEKIQPVSHECLHASTRRNCADTFSLFLIFSISSSTVGVFLLLHLPQPSEGGMLCNGRSREGKLSHGVGGWGPSPRFAGGQRANPAQPGLRGWRSPLRTGARAQLGASLQQTSLPWRGINLLGARERRMCKQASHPWESW